MSHEDSLIIVNIGVPIQDARFRSMTFRLGLFRVLLDSGCVREGEKSRK